MAHFAPLFGVDKNGGIILRQKKKQTACSYTYHQDEISMFSKTLWISKKEVPVRLLTGALCAEFLGTKSKDPYIVRFWKRNLCK